MLATTLWFVIVLALLASVMMDAAASFGRAGVHVAADHALEPVLNDAVADYQLRLQGAIAPLATSPGADLAGAAQSVPNPLQRTFAPDPAAVTSGPRFTRSYTVVPTTVAVPSCAPPSAAGSDTIEWLQCNPFVRESRISLHVTLRVLDAGGGELLAQREQFVTLRLFAEPPYSAVVGRKDGSALSPAGTGPLGPAAHEGDVGGDTVSGGSPPPFTGPWPSGGTLIHVRYECHDGTGSCANAAPPDPDADLRRNAVWTNGNQPAP